MSNRNNVISFSCSDRGLIKRAKERAKSQGFSFARFVVKLLLEEQGLTLKDLQTPRMGAPVRYPVENPALNQSSSKNDYEKNRERQADVKPLSFYSKKASKKSAAPKPPVPSANETH
jgi:hypothetical protein